MIDYFKYAVDEDGICTLTIDQPNSATNVMNQDFLDGFGAALDRALADDQVRGVILTSAKSSFVAGADLKSMEATLFGKPASFTHKTLFSFLGWLTFGILLYGRWRFGWRGRRALYWILAGTALLVLGYLGSKFVSEILLGR